MSKESTCLSVLLSIVGCIFLLLYTPLGPLIRFYDGWSFNWFQNRHISTWQAHQARVGRVQAQVKAWNTGGRKRRMCTSKPTWSGVTVHGLNKRELAQIDVTHLTNIVEIDEVNKVVTVEPGLLMGQLTSVLIPRGWTIGVVPELEVLTLGGTVCGAGIESGSTRYGSSSDICLEYEVILSNGDLVTCNKDTRPDLFYAIPSSHGTLGFVTAIKIPLLRAGKYVRLEYHVAKSVHEAQRLLESDSHDFVEGIAYGPNEFVITHGDIADDEKRRDGPVNHINYWYKPYFFQHCASFLRRTRNATPHVEYIPLRDYYHRHTRNVFWALVLIWPFSGTWFFRVLFGWMLPRNGKALRGIAETLAPNYQRFFERAMMNSMAQDFVFPIKYFQEAFNFSHDKVEMYPLWLCPIKLFNKPGMGYKPESPDSQLGLDLGLYGHVAPAKRGGFNYERTTHEFELWMLEHEGVQFTYADMFLSREEFCRMYDMSLYDKVRLEYDAESAFPHIYDKVGKIARRLEHVLPPEATA